MHWTIYHTTVQNWRMDLDVPFFFTDLSMKNALEANDLMFYLCNMSWIVVDGSVARLFHKDQRQTALWWWSSACFEMVLKQICLNPKSYFLKTPSQFFSAIFCSGSCGTKELSCQHPEINIQCPLQCAKWQAGVGLGLPPIQIFVIQRRGLQKIRQLAADRDGLENWMMLFWWPWLLSRLEDFGPAFSGWITTHTTGMDRHSIDVPELQIRAMGLVPVLKGRICTHGTTWTSGSLNNSTAKFGQLAWEYGGIFTFNIPFVEISNFPDDSGRVSSTVQRLPCHSS